MSCGQGGIGSRPAIERSRSISRLRERWTSASPHLDAGLRPSPQNLYLNQGSASTLYPARQYPQSAVDLDER